MLNAKSRKLPFVTDASYVNANPLGLPVGEKSYQKITRGHLASNVEMKSLGDPEEGLQAQKDSFSLANVVPQMQRHNAPIWAKLDDKCRKPGGRERGFRGPQRLLDDHEILTDSSKSVALQVHVPVLNALDFDSALGRYEAACST